MHKNEIADDRNIKFEEKKHALGPFSRNVVLILKMNDIVINSQETKGHLLCMYSLQTVQRLLWIHPLHPQPNMFLELINGKCIMEHITFVHC